MDRPRVVHTCTCKELHMLKTAAPTNSAPPKDKTFEIGHHGRISSAPQLAVCGTSFSSGVALCNFQRSNLGLHAVRLI